MTHSGDYLRICPLQHNRYTKTKKYGPNKRTDQNSKKELSNEEIAKPSDGKFKTLVTSILTEIFEYGHKIEEEVKAMKSEIKQNRHGTNSEGKETRTQINSLE